jgi:uncharacterized damage-inducible protein DinB
MLSRIRRLFRYDEWANREALASAAPPRALSLMAHVLGTEWLWLSRARREPSPVAVWPSWTAAECALQVDAVPRAWEAYLGALNDDRLQDAVPYVNSKGEPWSSTVEDMLLHTVLHSAYHRGQVAAEVRAAGGEPAYTDFVHAVRQGLVE